MLIISLARKNIEQKNLFTTAFPKKGWKNIRFELEVLLTKREKLTEKCHYEVSVERCLREKKRYSGFIFGSKNFCFQFHQENEINSNENFEKKARKFSVFIIVHFICSEKPIREIH